MRSTPSRLAACCGLAACALGAHALANIEAAWISNTQYTYRARFVPDFDQRRSALPSNGANYCVPTSVLNWSAYIARRGHPDQLPGPPPWNYTIINLNLVLLGNLMNTDPDGGTSPSDGVAGAQAWLNGRAFCLVVTGNTTNGFPRLRTLANMAINNNALVVPRVGWYSESNIGGGNVRITRQGGHAVSMVRAAAAGASNQLIGLHDPAWTPSGDTQTVQSPFTMNTYAVEDRIVFEGNSSLPSVMSRIMGYGGSTPGYIYGAYYILPYVVLTPVSFNLNVHALNFNNLSVVQTTSIANPARGVITNVFQAMDPQMIYYSANNFIGAGGRLVKYDRLENTHSLLATLGDDFVDVCASRHERLYVMQGRTLTCLNPTTAPATPEASMVVGTGIDAIAYDDDNDDVVGLRPATRQIVRVDASLNTPASTVGIPTQVPIEAGGSIDVRVGDGAILIATPASASAYILTPSDIVPFSVETVSIPGNTQPLTGGSFTDRGVVLAFNGRTKEMEPDGAGGWRIVPDSPFDNLPTSGKVYAARSRTDVDYATQNAPGNADVLPAGFAGATHERACGADVDANGVVNFLDLNAVLTSFGQAGPNVAGDTDGDGVVDFIDLNAVLSNFGQDCG